MSVDTSELSAKLWESLHAAGEVVLKTSLDLGSPELSESPSLDDDAVVCALEATDNGEEGWIVLDRKSACAIAGLLLERPQSELQENVSAGNFLADDLDAIEEFAGKIVAPINAAVEQVTGTKANFVFRKSSADGSIKPDFADTVVFSSGLSPGGLAPGNLQLILPRVPLGLDAPVDDGDQPSPGDEDDPGAGPSLTPEELAAIREATQEMGRGARALFVVPLERERDRWKERLDESELDYAFSQSSVGIPQELRSGEFGVVVIDADTCPSGGLYALAKVRTADVPSLVVAVLVSSPTKTHLIGCLAAGAHLYLRKPIETNKLLESLGTATAAA